MRKLHGTFIGFCGAGGVGKTSTALSLCEKLADYEFLPSVSRAVFARRGVESEEAQLNMTPQERWELQRDIQMSHLNESLKLSGQKRIADRTQMDQFAYALQYCHEVLTARDLADLMDFVDAAISQYRLVFYFPLTTFPGQTDGMRTSSFGSRMLFDRTLRGIIEMFQVPTIEVPIMNIGSRCTFIIENMSARGLPYNRA